MQWRADSSNEERAAVLEVKAIEEKLAQLEGFPLENVKAYNPHFLYNLEKTKVNAKKYEEELKLPSIIKNLKTLISCRRGDHYYTVAYFVLLKALEKDKNIEYQFMTAAKRIDAATRDSTTDSIAEKIQKAQFEVWKGFAASRAEAIKKVFRHQHYRLKLTG
ncbi:hypothetical protein PsorP6_011167 [Peronosclerospora sorghi]|uniref:Uncharacterized protein n=1 Tax=Peronosclerospora sorghi TaxID=230839 RepID=A0ACC0VZQ2_9STRA|nr:hypothetical protein PsorP6_011167 [Peronosclerospora sorghi]